MKSDSCFVVKGSLTLEMDLLRMSGCRSMGHGGALRTLGDLTVIGGKLEFDDCHAFQGGAVYVEGRTQIRGGEATFTKCTASMSVRGFNTRKATHKFLREIHRVRFHQLQYCGGGLAVDGSLLLQEARMTFESCSAEEFGGALCVIGGFDQQGGSMNFNTCTSGRAAGGVYVNGSFYEESGAMYFKNCTSSEKGGGMFLRCTQAGSKSCGISQSRLTFRSCSSAVGGGLSLSGALDLMHSNASFEYCRAAIEGGGLGVTSGSAVSARVVSLEFKQCAAGRYGGGIHSLKAKMRLDQSNMTFVECTAGRIGGGFAVRDGRLTHARGKMSFHFCKAYAGAAFSSTLGAELADVDVDMCTSLGAEVTSSMGNISIQRLTFVYDGPSAGYEPSLVAPNVSISEVNCTATHQCTLRAATLRIPSLLCPPGREIEKHSASLPHEPHHGCRLCEPGHFQPLPWRNPYCFPCPGEAKACDAVSVTMQAGYMLNVPNLSSLIDFSELESVKRTYFCPNAASCPGGRLAYQNQTAMCSPGATGEGCEFSTPGYADGDYANPYGKFECPTAPSVWVAAASYLFGKDLFVFVLASSSVLGAKAGRKESAVLVNHLMAFGIIASRCLAALMQTEVFAGQSVFFRDVLDAWGIVIDTGTGQAASGTPVSCFPKAMYDDSGLTGFFLKFALANAPALLLVCVFGCAKGFWLSIIVGSNCFLPAFCGRLSTLLISFRPTAADGPRFYYDIDNGQQWMMVLATVMVLTICFSATIWLFLRATHSDQDPGSLQVLYLAAPYKPQYASWEVERLLRKMTFSVICTAFPVTMHPMTQLALLACISIVSAALYLKLQPYSLAKFNEMETGLLLAANVMAVLTLLSSHPSADWGTYLPGIQFAAGMAAVSIGTGCTVWMAILIGAAFMTEREKE
ncbi:unnamed protein product [Symbiodinium sp. CCMP2592]|nr:unnamed protein product [Symbiodinium sp. CCMP2592]